MVGSTSTGAKVPIGTPTATKTQLAAEPSAKNKRNKKSKKTIHFSNSDPKLPAGALTQGARAEVTLIGDSQLRGLEGLMSAGCRRVKVKSLPGKGNRVLRGEVEKLPVAPSAVLVAAVSGNDLYRRSGAIGSTETIISEVMGAVDDMALRSKRRVVVGMLPRAGASSYAYSKNIGINRRLADLCLPEGVLFVDPYPAFYGRSDLYLRDGVHLSQKGRSCLSDMIVDATKRVSRIMPGEKHAKVSKVVPERSYASVVTKGTDRTPSADRSGNGSD